MKTGIETALKTLEILLENPEELKQKAEGAISHGKKANEILQKYMRLSSMPEWDYATEEKEIALKPEEITEFFEKSKAYKAHKLYAAALSEFTTRLVKESYKKGGNGFLLDANGINGLEDLCNKIEGKKSSPLKISIIGNAGKSFCITAQHCIITMESGLYSYGIYGRACTFRTENKKLADSIMQNIMTGTRQMGLWRYNCRIRENEANKVYMIEKDKDNLYWSEDCWEFKRELEDEAALRERHRSPDDQEPD